MIGALAQIGTVSLICLCSETGGSCSQSLLSEGILDILALYWL